MLAVVVLVILIVIWLGYKRWGQERLSQPITDDICTPPFGASEELRVSAVNAGSRTYERWILTAVGLPAGSFPSGSSTSMLGGQLQVQQGVINMDGTYQPQINLAKAVSFIDAGTIRRLIYGKPYADAAAGLFTAGTMLQQDGVICPAVATGWMWTFATPNKCITRDCQGRVPATDAVQTAIMNLARQIPGYQSVAPSS